MGKLSAFLRAKRTKKTTLTASDKPRNEYYENVSVRMGTAQVVLYLLLLAFIVLSLLFNTELITYRNFYLFFQDLNASAETVDIFSTDSISYPVADEQSFAVYRKGLAVAGNSSVTVFSATGRQIVSESVNYRKPVAVGTGKYLLVYEMGGLQYSLYNSYTKIHSGKSEYPISGAAVSESGMYALCSAGKDSTTVVSLYSERFNLLGRYTKSGYVTGVAIDDGGEMLAILALNPDGGLLSTELMLAKPGESEAHARVSFSQTAGLACTFTASGRVAVLCDDGVRYVSRRGEVREKYGFEGRTLAAFALGEDGVCVALKKSEVSPKNVVIVFDKNGKIVYNEDAGEEVVAISRCGDSVFWMTKRGVACMDLNDGTRSFKSCNTTDRALLAVSEREALCCSAQKAYYVSFRN